MSILHVTQFLLINALWVALRFLLNETASHQYEVSYFDHELTSRKERANLNHTFILILQFMFYCT